jgi:hypothetical protein
MRGTYWSSYATLVAAGNATVKAADTSATQYITDMVISASVYNVGAVLTITDGTDVKIGPFSITTTNGNNISIHFEKGGLRFPKGTGIIATVAGANCTVGITTVGYTMDGA